MIKETCPICGLIYINKIILTKARKTTGFFIKR